jgi:hypothetical protein
MNAKKAILSAAAALYVLAMLSVSIRVSARIGTKPPVTFEKDVAPILQDKCQECHRPGGVAPMSLVSYVETRPWAVAIKEKVVMRAMPPFYAAGPTGYYENDTRLTEEEISVITRWVDSGAPRGNASDHPKDRDWYVGKQGQKPDLVLKTRMPYTLKKDAIDDYELFAFDYTFLQDTWISGIEVHPGNKSAVHHIAIYILPDRLTAGPDGRVEGAGADTLIMGGQLVLFWNPGSLPRMFKDGSAMLIQKGSRLGIQVHYAPTTKDNVVDQSWIGLHYATGVVDRMVHFQYGGKSRIDIPAGEEHYQLIDYKKFRTDALITMFGAHMHLRGKSFTIRLIYPDGRKETVFELPQFYFYWQRSYSLVRPLAIPKGTVAEYTAVWDNSPRNPYNPDPKQSVHFGFRTSDEMMGASIIYVDPQEKLAIPVKNGVRVNEAEAIRSRNPK